MMIVIDVVLIILAVAIIQGAMNDIGSRFINKGDRVNKRDDD